MTTDHARAAAIEVSKILNGILDSDRQRIQEMFARHIDAATEGLRQRAESAEAEARRLREAWQTATGCKTPDDVCAARATIDRSITTVARQRDKLKAALQEIHDRCSENGPCHNIRLLAAIAIKDQQ